MVKSSFWYKILYLFQVLKNHVDSDRKTIGIGISRKLRLYDLELLRDSDITVLGLRFPFNKRIPKQGQMVKC